MNYTYPIAGGNYYDIFPQLAKIASLEIYNEGPADVFYGDVPSSQVITALVDYANGDTFVDLLRPPANLAVGMRVTSDKPGFAAAPDGSLLSLIEPIPTGVISGGRRVYFEPEISAPATGALLTFRAPFITELTGIPIRPDNKEIFTGADGNWLSQGGFRIWAGAGGATIRVRQKSA